MTQNPTIDDLSATVVAIRDGARELLHLGWPAAERFHQILGAHPDVLAHSFGLGPSIEPIRGGLRADCETWKKLYAHAESYPTHPEFRAAALGKGDHRDGSPQRIVDRCDALLVGIRGMA